jgi:hypothetical protein
MREFDILNFNDILQNVERYYAELLNMGIHPSTLSGGRKVEFNEMMFKEKGLENFNLGEILKKAEQLDIALVNLDTEWSVLLLTRRGKELFNKYGIGLPRNIHYAPYSHLSLEISDTGALLARAEPGKASHFQYFFNDSTEYLAECYVRMLTEMHTERERERTITIEGAVL